MVSTVRFRSLRDLVTARTRQARITTGLVVLAVVVALALAPAATALTASNCYVLPAPLCVLTAPLRRRWIGPGSVAPPRHRQQSGVVPPSRDDAPTPDSPHEPPHTPP